LFWLVLGGKRGLGDWGLGGGGVGGRAKNSGLGA